jgi:hemoglobin
MSEEELFYQLGGEKALEATTELLIEKLTKDSLLSDYFKNIDIKTHKFFLKNYLCMFTGGPQKYNGKSIRDAHRDLELKDDDFNRLIYLIKETLNELNIKEELISKFISAAESLRNEVLNI